MWVLYPSRGFTLLELLIVLGLVSVISAVVFPGLVRLFDSVSANIEKEEIVLSINALGRQAFESGRAFSLDPSALELPAGWRIEVAQPIVYSATGVCLGGTLSLIKNDELELRQKVTPPYCQISTDEN